jgi:hypothetical protein
MKLNVHAILLVAHTFGVLAAAIAAVIEIETIVGTGPILAFTGGMIAFLSYRSHRRIGIAFGLAATASAIAWFLTIFSLDWGPSTAHLPVSLFFVVFACASIPSCTFCIMETFPPGDRSAGQFQFGIATMLSITFLEALYLGILRAFDIFAQLSKLFEQ